MMQADRPDAVGGVTPSWMLTVALVVLVIVIGAARISVEAPFFFKHALVTSAGVAPVPQDDADTPALDRALRSAATALPADSVCVITRDSWSREYFRASYLLMPRDVWPVAPLLTRNPPSIEMIAGAIARHGANCLLVEPGVAIPPGWRLLTSGAYAAYVPVGPS
jgi:hypothetical protein